MMRKMRYLYITLMFLFLTACGTVKIKEVPIETVKTEYVSTAYRDSIYVHDSIDRYVSGDTIYTYKYKYIYKYINNTDTVERCDTIEVPIEVTKQEIKEVNKIKWY